jgi:hypothetical protein
MKIFDNEFSGMTVFRSMDSSYRIAFINEIGMKFFDFELYEESFQIRHIFEPMNKKMLIQLLIGDYRLLLNYPQSREQGYFYDETTRENVIQPSKTRDLFYYDGTTGLPTGVFRFSRTRQIMEIKYSEYSDSIPQKITVRHTNIKFTMHMSYIK